MPRRRIVALALAAISAFLSSTISATAKPRSVSPIFHIDNVETRDSRRIIPGVCFSFEPGIYQPAKFGVRSEIDVYVRDRDIEVTGQLFASSFQSRKKASTDYLAAWFVKLKISR